MSATESNLSSPRYGYDFVVATTQASINATMKAYLRSVKQPQVIRCFVLDDDDNTVEISYPDLLKATKGTDPFRVPDQAPASGTDMQNLINAGFLCAFRATMGLPPGYKPQQIPDIITLNGDTSSVGFNLMCSEFTLAQITYGRKATFLSQSQPSGNAWIFASKVDMRLTQTPDTAYSRLPEAVQRQIKNMGGHAFSVQQLLFDLQEVMLLSTPVITGVAPDSNLALLLQKWFVKDYLDKLKETGNPVMGYTVTQSTAPPASLTLTDFTFADTPMVGTNGQPLPAPTPDQRKLATLSYLCAANGHPLPPPTAFTWNWVDEAEAADCHGALAINADTFLDWLGTHLSPDLNPLCKKPACDCHCGAFGCDYSLAFSPETRPQHYTRPQGQSPDKEGFTKVLTFHYTESSEAKGGTEGLQWGNLKSVYTVDSNVYAGGSQVRVVTRINAFIHLNREGGVTEGNFATYEATNLFTLSVDSNGTLVVTEAPPAIVDQSQNIDYSTWAEIATLGHIKTVLNEEKAYCKATLNNLLTTFAKDLHSFISGPQSWVFPGGESFVFSNVCFSAHTDLVSHITYAKP